MAITTIYDVKTRYLVNDKASAPLKGIGDKAERAGKKTATLKKKLLGLAAVTAVGFGIKRALGFAISYNSMLEQTRIKLAGLAGKEGASFEDRMRSASKVMSEIERKAVKLPVTFKEIIPMVEDIASPMKQAGLNMAQIGDLAIDATVAAKALNMTNIASLDVQQAILGTLSTKDRFMKTILGMAKMTTEEFNAMARADPSRAARKLTELFRMPQLKQMAKAQEGTFAGVTSALESTFQTILGKVGKPLFEALTAEIKRWNFWISQNGALIKSVAKDVGEGFVSVFKATKAAGSFIVKHKTLLMTMAKGFLIFRAARFGAGFMANFAAGVTMFGKKLGTANGALGKFGGGLQGFIGKLGVVVGALGIFKVALEGLANFIDERQEERQAKEVKKARVEDIAKSFLKERATGQFRGEEVRSAGWALKDRALMEGFINNQGTINREAIAKFAGIPESMREAFVSGGKEFIVSRAKEVPLAKEIELSGEIVKSLQQLIDLEKVIGEKIITSLEARTAGGFFIDPGIVAATLGETFGQVAASLGKALGLEPEEKKMARPPGVKIGSITIEVPARDPDRFVHDMSAALEKLNRAPTQAATALRGGF